MPTASSGFVVNSARVADEVTDAHARIDKQIVVAPAHMPDVALPDRVEVGLPEERDGFVDPLDLEPSLGDWECHRGFLSANTEQPTPAHRGHSPL